MTDKQQGVRAALVNEAQFLVDRLKEYDPEDADHVRDYMGHVEPSLTRLDRILERAAPIPNAACFLERSKVRQILIEQPDENLEITEVVLSEIDELPIFTAEDFTPLPSEGADNEIIEGYKKLVGSQYLEIEKLRAQIATVPSEGAEAWLPVKIKIKASGHNGGVIVMATGRELLISKKEEASIVYATPPSASPSVREATIKECLKKIDDMGTGEAGLFDAKHSGQRGKDRSDALYDAYEAIRALSSGEQEGSKVR